MKINVKRPKLTSYQKDFLYNDSRFTITEASTKVGKTFAHIWWIYERAHEDWNKKGYNHWWVAPVYAQAKIAFTRLRNKIAFSGAYKINESNLTITTPLGSVIHFKSAEKPDNLFGEDVYSIVFDEAPRAKVDAYYALRSTITATKGKMKLIGNFGGVSNWMHQLKEKSKTDNTYRYFKITAWDAVKEGILEEQEILQAQKDLPPKVFKQLYLAEEQESEDQLVSFDVMRSFWTNNFLEKEYGTKGKINLPRYITADIALHGSDKFRILVWDGWTVIYHLEIDKCDADEVERVLKSIAEKFNVMRHNIVYDADGLGSFLRGYLKGAKPFNNNAKPIGQNNYKNLKSQCGYELAKHCNKVGIYILEEVDLKKEDVYEEFECLQSYNLDNEGKMQLLPKSKIKEIIGHSPDLLDNFIMRMFFDIKAKRGKPSLGFA